MQSPLIQLHEIFVQQLQRSSINPWGVQQLKQQSPKSWQMFKQQQSPFGFLHQDEQSGHNLKH